MKRDIWLERAGARLYALDEGAGQTLVMLHGGLASHVASLPLVRSLSERFRVLTPDLRGNGRSISGEVLTFDVLADDIAALLDHVGTVRALVGGVSSGSGVALRFAFRHPARAAGLVIVKPVYAGAELGYADSQRQAFAGMDAVASRAVEEGVQVLRPLYARLPEEMRERALEMLEGFDPTSVVATSRFLVSGAQPFASASDLALLRLPTLIVRGDDPLHPSEVSDLYVDNLPGCQVVPAATQDVAGEIGSFATGFCEWGTVEDGRDMREPGL